MKLPKPQKRRHTYKRKKLLVFFLSCSLVIFCGLCVFYLYIFHFSPTQLVRPIPAFSSVKGISTRTQTAAIVEVRRLCKEENIPITDITERADLTIEINQSGGEKILFSTTKPIEEQISSLQLVLTRLTIEGKRFESLDFRFDTPVVVFR